ncbi:RNA polymerase I-specific transcription initiation factor Rrn3p [Monosporozyma servazzii]
MMAFENTTKRSSQEVMNSVDSKKRKVEFAKDVTLYPISNNEGEENTVKSSEEINGFSCAIYARFVKSALDDLDKNDSTQIDVLADQLSLGEKSSEKIKPENLNVLLDILSSNINRIDSPKGIVLIQSLISLNKWWELPSVTLSKYIYFIRILCSSIPKWWQDVSKNLISNFPSLSLNEAHYHHDLLHYFLVMIPSSMNFVDSYLVKFFPNKNDTRKSLVNHVGNILYLTKYCKELRFQVWSLIVEKIISIDVELQNELDEMDDDIESDFEDDDDDDDDDEDEDDDKDKDTSLMDEDEDEDEEVEGVEEYNVEVTQNIKELANKLDAILTIVSTNISNEVTAESIENGDGVSIFNTLTTLFKTHILPTYYTRSIQYVMFHLSQQQLELMDSFLVTLIDISFAPNETAEKKIKSLQYLGSYIARAKKLSRTQIIFVASYLTSWLNRYAIEREEEVDQPGGMERFKHFYAAFQALCYIFCFRRDIFKDLDGNWECELDKFYQRMIISKFNPLKYCNENVMLMFARIAQHEDIAYCFTIIENNNNERLRGIVGKADGGKKSGATGVAATSSVWSLATRQQFIDLQSYFPFDPLFLKNYKEMMKDYFIEWSEASGELESDHESD